MPTCWEGQEFPCREKLVFLAVGDLICKTQMLDSQRSACLRLCRSPSIKRKPGWVLLSQHRTVKCPKQSFF